MTIRCVIPADGAMDAVRSEANASGHRFDDQRQWQAALALRFEADARDTSDSGRAITRLTRRRHHGPLRVQRPFYPEGRHGCCHVYLLHLRVGWSAAMRCRSRPRWRRARMCC